MAERVYGVARMLRLTDDVTTDPSGRVRNIDSYSFRASLFVRLHKVVDFLAVNLSYAMLQKIKKKML